MTTKRTSTDGDGDQGMRVSFDVRDLLKEIKDAQTTGFAEIKAALLSKADKADVSRLEGRLDSHGERIMALEQKDRDETVEQETHRSHDDRKWSTRKKVWTTFAGLLTLLVTFWAPYAAIHLHL